MSAPRGGGAAGAARRPRGAEPVSPARAAAYRALLRLRSGGRLDESLAALPELDGLGERDRALANELVTGTVKRRGSIDAVLGAYTKAPLRHADSRVLEALRLAAYQLLFLDRVPAYAAVNDAVAMAMAGTRGARGFVNAILRRVAREGGATLATLAAGDSARAWSVRHSCPAWLIGLLRAELGDEAAERFFLAANGAPERCLRVNRLKGDVSAARAELGPTFVTHEVPGLPDALLYEGSPLERSAVFRAGLVTPQSRGSQVAGLVAAAGAASGARVLDLCAAPGTKTAQLAGLAPGASVTAVDADAGRVETLRANLSRLGVTADVVHADVLELSSAYDASWDAVLLDAPCSGLGTMASRPDLRWRRRREDVDRLAALQKRLLARAARCVRPGGTLTYSVCTLPRAETVDVVDDLLRGGGWVADDLGPAWPGLAHPAAGGYLLLVPPACGSTGFFVARLRRAGGAGL